MTREEYQQSLADLRAAVLSMSDRVTERLKRALTALETADETVARSVVSADDEIDQLYLDLEATCIKLFAQQQPVAGDLRFVASSFKIVTDLERVGDLAVNLAKYSLDATPEWFAAVDLSAMGDLAADLLADAMTAYRTDDASLCRQIAARDADLDILCQHASEHVVRDLLERAGESTDTWALERVLDDVTRLLLTVRDLERVGDHAVNVAARSLYMIESDPTLI